MWWHQKAEDEMCGAPVAAVACGGAAQGTLSFESEGDVQSSVASWSGVAEAARASHFWRPIFFFFLKKQQHLVSETTSTSTGNAMGVLE